MTQIMLKFSFHLSFIENKLISFLKYIPPSHTMQYTFIDFDLIFNPYFFLLTASINYFKTKYRQKTLIPYGHFGKRKIIEHIIDSWMNKVGPIIFHISNYTYDEDETTEVMHLKINCT